MTNRHSIDLNALSRTQLKQLLSDTQEQLHEREAEDRAVLAERCKSIATELGFDETAVRVIGTTTRAVRKPRVNARGNGNDDHD